MEAVVLVLHLCAGCATIDVPAAQCSEMIPWLQEAWAWAERSGVNRAANLGGPWVTCRPAARIVVARRG